MPTRIEMTDYGLPDVLRHLQLARSLDALAKVVERVGAFLAQGYAAP